MDEDVTDRLGLPILHAGQAQKEITHNEALVLIDLALAAAVEAVGVNMPPAAPAAGACWIVGGAPSGAWAGHADALAGWTGNGWRFVAAREGLRAWSIADGVEAVFRGGQWRLGAIAATALSIGGQQVVGARRPAIAAPVGGSVVDLECRARLGEILASLRAHGLVANP